MLLKIKRRQVEQLFKTESKQWWMAGEAKDKERTCVVITNRAPDDPAATCTGEDGTLYADGATEYQTDVISQASPNGNPTVQTIGDHIDERPIDNPSFIPDEADIAEWAEWDNEQHRIDNEGNRFTGHTFTILSTEEDTEWTILDAPEDQLETVQQKFIKTYVTTWASGTVTNSERVCLVTERVRADDPAPMCTGEDGTLYADGETEFKTTTIDAVQISYEIDDDLTMLLDEETIPNPNFVDLPDNVRFGDWYGISESVKIDIDGNIVEEIHTITTAIGATDWILVEAPSDQKTTVEQKFEIVSDQRYTAGTAQDQERVCESTTVRAEDLDPLTCVNDDGDHFAIGAKESRYHVLTQPSKEGDAEKRTTDVVVEEREIDNPAL